MLACACVCLGVQLHVCACMVHTHEVKLWVLFLRCQPPLVFFFWSYFCFEIGFLTRLGLSLLN